MAGGSEGGEKTEKPTPKKLQDAAKKGDILQSRELGTALVVMAGIGWLAVTGPSMIDALSDMLTRTGPGSLRRGRARAAVWCSTGDTRSSLTPSPSR